LKLKLFFALLNGCFLFRGEIPGRFLFGGGLFGLHGVRISFETRAVGHRLCKRIDGTNVGGLLDEGVRERVHVRQGHGEGAERGEG
jgi:hypothetical protein